MEEELLRLMKRRIAQTAAGATALRNQGGRGVVAAAQEALEKVKLERFDVATQEQFAHQLDLVTELVRRALPPPARWGTARKATNLFLRSVFYNHYLRREFALRKLERWLELPLDSQTIKGLKTRWREMAPEAEWTPKRLPRFTVSGVDPDTYLVFQEAANNVAHELGIPARVHLDLLWWRAED